MARAQRLICGSAALVDGGPGMRFEFARRGIALPAFAVRSHGTVYAYLNRCAHVPIELDWHEGEFFDAFGLYLVCTTHGASYDPATGRCVAGPCRGRQLTPLDVVERNGAIYVFEDEFRDGRD